MAALRARRAARPRVARARARPRRLDRRRARRRRPPRQHAARPGSTPSRSPPSTPTSCSTTAPAGRPCTSSDGVLTGAHLADASSCGRPPTPTATTCCCSSAPSPTTGGGPSPRAVVDLALELGTRMVVGLGAYPAPVPHTRPTAAGGVGVERASWPRFCAVRDDRRRARRRAGRHRAAAAEVGLPAIGLWAQVPHYASAMPSPAAAAALLDGLAQRRRPQRSTSTELRPPAERDPGPDRRAGRRQPRARRDGPPARGAVGRRGRRVRRSASPPARSPPATSSPPRSSASSATRSSERRGPFLTGRSSAARVARP